MNKDKLVTLLCFSIHNGKQSKNVLNINIRNSQIENIRKRLEDIYKTENSKGIYFTIKEK